MIHRRTLNHVAKGLNQQQGCWKCLICLQQLHSSLYFSEQASLIMTLLAHRMSPSNTVVGSSLYTIYNILKYVRATILHNNNHKFISKQTYKEFNVIWSYLFDSWMLMNRILIYSYCHLIWTLIWNYNASIKQLFSKVKDIWFNVIQKKL